MVFGPEEVVKLFALASREISKVTFYRNELKFDNGAIVSTYKYVERPVSHNKEFTNHMIEKWLNKKFYGNIYPPPISVGASDIIAVPQGKKEAVASGIVVAGCTEPIIKDLLNILQAHELPERPFYKKFIDRMASLMPPMWPKA